MIRRIRLENFKCFEGISISCASLNLFCGLNGMGKSSVIQALLMIRQSCQSGHLQSGHMTLNGKLIDLGTGGDILWDGALNDRIEVELEANDISDSWTASLKYSRDSDQLSVIDPQKSLVTEQWRQIPPFGGRLTFVSAERIGPRRFHGLTESRALLHDFGHNCEHALNYLSHFQGQLLTADDPRCRNQNQRRLLDVVDTWLQEISPGAHLQLRTLREAGLLLVGYSFDREGDISSRPFRATNVGFGLSYCLPVVLALLLESSPCSLCLIENPEAHLHPYGQTKLGELAVRAACAGVQVVLETHSDHVLDGVRIAVRKDMIAPDDVSIQYFERRGSASIVHEPRLNREGRLSSWPRGFFDQHEENLAQLLDW